VKFGSLFSGIGGFDLGFERAGLECIWQIEKDKDCNRVLSNHWPNVQRFDDVTTVREFEPADVICGGFPCQDLSVAGKRKGLAGERSGLWFEFLRIAESNLPRFVVIENVPGLLSSDQGRDFGTVLRGLVECGYCVGWRVLDAQYDGVAQRRRRVFIVGSLGNGSCAEILFESESVSWNPPTRREAGERIAATIRGGSAGSSTHGKRNGSDQVTMIEVRNGGPPNLIALSSKDHGADAGNIAPTLRSQNFKDSHMNGGGQVAIAYRDDRGRGNDCALEEVTYPLHCAKGQSEQQVVACHENKSGQLSEADVLGLRSGASHSYQGVGGNFGVRRLTPRECERLQSFPDDWTRWDSEEKEISDSARYRMLGNAVCVNVAEWIGKRIIQVK
jgi:DNA (cytosine-5)-methyltransferase 1